MTERLIMLRIRDNLLIFSLGLTWLVSCLVESTPTNHVNLLSLDQDDEAVSQRNLGIFPFYVPVSYDLTLQIDTRDSVKYSGRVNIVLKVSHLQDGTVSKLIKLNLGPNVMIKRAQYLDHTGDLRVDQASALENHGIINIRDPRYDAREKMLHIQLERYPTRPTGQLMIEFDSIIPTLNETENQGIFHMETLDKSIYVISDFANHKASLVFPCFDTGIFKTPMTVTIIRTNEQDIYSTTPHVALQREIYFSNRYPSSSLMTQSIIAGKLTQFRQTDPIEVDSFAFAVGPFQELKQTLDSGIKLTVVAEKSENLKDIASIVKSVGMIAANLENYSATKLRSEQITIIALPQNHRIERRIYPGFMIASIEDLTIDLESKSSKLNNIVPLRNLSEFLILESNNLMFTNYNDVCVREDHALTMGFVALIQKELTRQVLEETSSDSTIPIDIYKRLLVMDTSIKSKTAIEMVGMSNLRDLYKYKTAAILRMFLADRALTNIILNQIILLYYGSKRAFIRSNVASTSTGIEDCSDLANFLLTFQPNITLETLYDWLKQPGIPMVYMTISGNIMTLTQKRLVLDAEYGNVVNVENVDLNQEWLIPVTYTMSDGRDISREGNIIWFQKGAQAATIITQLPDWFQLENPFHFIKLNEKMQGYYRVSYPIPMIERMQMAISSREMHESDRLDILTNVGLMWEADLIDSEFFVKFLSWYRYEPVGIVAESLVSWYRQLLQRFTLSPLVLEYIKEFGIILFNRLYKKHGFNFNGNLSSHQERSLVEVYKLLITLKYDKILNDARVARLKLQIIHKDPIPRALMIAALVGQDSIMTTEKYAKLVEDSFKNDPEYDIVIFGASMLPDTEIEILWQLLQHLDMRKRLLLVKAMVACNKGLQILAVFLVTHLTTNENSSVVAGLLEILETIMLNVDEDTFIIINSHIQHVSGYDEFFERVTTKYLKRSELAARDVLKLISFFHIE